MKSIFLKFCIFFLCLVGFQAYGASKSSHEVYFEQTDSELHVYRIQGRFPGKTLMIIGGIQGDEPGGYLAADLYADLSLRRGQLILVPRANFLSILKGRRQINKDMNRQFAQKKQITYEDKVVSILQKLMAESDLLLNLHEGSGFYNPKWVNNRINPMRYGQSIIADADVYKQGDKVIRLKEIAEHVTQTVNHFIEHEKFHFSFNNHKTQSRASRHKEQRRSATYYALTELGIPAFGVETSKDIKDLDFKVRMQSMVINAFMEWMGVELENPSMYLPKPVLDFALVEVNNQYSHVLRHGETLTLQSGDLFRITHLQSNYKRGLTADVVGDGGNHDLNKYFTLLRDVKIVFKKDKFLLGEAKIKKSSLKQNAPQNQMSACEACTTQMMEEEYRSELHGSLESLLIRRNKKLVVIHKNEEMVMNWGDRVQIIGTLSESSTLHRNLVHNFVGYYGGVNGNVEDDTGLIYKLSPQILLKRFAVSKTGDRYRIYTKVGDQEVVEFFVKLKGSF